MNIKGNKKGFTLLEVMVVVVIIGILAALSVPMILDYRRDANNDRAKSILFIIAQGYKNFKNDFPKAQLARQLELGSKINTNTLNCNAAITKFTNNGPITESTAITAADLISCSYLPNIDYNNLNYAIYVGECCGTSTGSLSCMLGLDGGGKYSTNYCAYVLNNNKLEENFNISQSQNNPI